MGCNTSSPTTSQPSPAAVLVHVIGARQTFGLCYGKMPDPSLGFGTGAFSLSECLPVPFCRITCGGRAEYTSAAKGPSGSGTAFPCWNHDTYFPLPYSKPKAGSPSSSTSRTGSRAGSNSNRLSLDISIFDRNPQHLDVGSGSQSPTTARRGRTSSAAASKASAEEASGVTLIGHATFNLLGVADLSQARRYWLPLEDSPSSGEVGLILYPCCGVDIILQEVQFFHNVGRDGQPTPSHLRDSVVDFNQLEMLKNFHFSVEVGQQPAQSTSQRKTQLNQRKCGWNRSMRFFLPACGDRRAHHVARIRLWTEESGETDLGEEASKLVAACWVLLPNLKKLNSEGAPTFLDGVLCNEEMKSVGHIRMCVSRCPQREFLESLQPVLSLSESRTGLPAALPQMFTFECAVLSALNVAQSNEKYAKALEQWHEAAGSDKNSEQLSHSDEYFSTSLDDGISPSSLIMETEPPFVSLQPGAQLQLLLSSSGPSPSYTMHPVAAFSDSGPESEGISLQASTWNSTVYFGCRLEDRGAPCLFANLASRKGKSTADPHRHSELSTNIGSCQVSLGPFLARGPWELWAPLTNCRGELGFVVSPYHALKISLSTLVLLKALLPQWCESFLGRGRPTGVRVQVTLSRPTSSQSLHSSADALDSSQFGTHCSSVLPVTESEDGESFQCQVDEEFRFHFPPTRSTDLSGAPSSEGSDKARTNGTQRLQLTLVVSLVSIFPSMPALTGTAGGTLGEVGWELDLSSREVSTGSECFLNFRPCEGYLEASTEPVSPDKEEANPLQHGIHLSVLEEGPMKQSKRGPTESAFPLDQDENSSSAGELDIPSRPKLHLLDWEIVAARGLRPPLNLSPGVRLQCSMYFPLQGSLLKVDAPSGANLVHPDFHAVLSGLPYPDVGVGRAEFRLELRNSSDEQATAAGETKMISLGSRSLDFSSLAEEGLLQRGHPSQDSWLRLSSGGELCVHCTSRSRFKLTVSGLFRHQENDATGSGVLNGQDNTDSSSALNFSVLVSVQGADSASTVQQFSTAARRGVRFESDGANPDHEKVRSTVQWCWNEDFTFFSRSKAKEDDRLVFEVRSWPCGVLCNGSQDRKIGLTSSPLRAADRNGIFPFPMKGEASLSSAGRGGTRCLEIPMHPTSVAEEGGRPSQQAVATLRILLLEEGASNLQQLPISNLSEREAKLQLDPGTVAAEQVSLAAKEAADLVSRYLQGLSKKP
jgi:hypothetical protein